MRPTLGVHRRDAAADGEHQGAAAAADGVLWARIAIDQFRHLALQTVKQHRASSNIFSDKVLGLDASATELRAALQPFHVSTSYGLFPSSRLRPPGTVLGAQEISTVEIPYRDMSWA